MAIAQYVIDPAGATGGILAELRELGKTSKGVVSALALRRAYAGLLVAAAATFGIGAALADWTFASFVAAPFILAAIALFFVLFADTSFVGLMLLVSIGLDDDRPMRGVGRAIRRRFGRPYFKRALIAAVIASSVAARADARSNTAAAVAAGG